MDIGTKLYVTEREQWRAWLAENHDKLQDIWLVFYRKASGKPRLPYNDAVEEALCFGWIDSIVKSIDDESFAQRFSRRRPKSNLSEMNKERIRRLIVSKKMTDAGLEAVKHAYDPDEVVEPIDVAPDILDALKREGTAWDNFRNFPEPYKRIRIGFIEGARSRPEIFQKRLNYFVKMTSKNKKFGMVQ